MGTWYEHDLTFKNSELSNLFKAGARALNAYADSKSEPDINVTVIVNNDTGDINLASNVKAAVKAAYEARGKVGTDR